MNAQEVVEAYFQKIIDDNPQGFILRSELKKKTFGLIKSASYMANLDSQGVGIKDRFLIRNQTAYPVSSVIKFLKKSVYIPEVDHRRMEYI